MGGDKVIEALRQMDGSSEPTENNQRNPGSLKHILAPTDLTRDARKAVDYAVALARDFGARLTLLHVHNSNFNCDYVFGTNDYSDEDRYRAEAEKGLRQWRGDYKEEGTCIDICFRVGAPCEEIAAAASESKTDLIVISTHHYHWLDHLMNGSDAERIVRRARCPILVVPEDSGYR
jgi:universal stress protein A